MAKTDVKYDLDTRHGVTRSPFFCDVEEDGDVEESASGYVERLKKLRATPFCAFC